MNDMDKREKWRNVKFAGKSSIGGKEGMHTHRQACIPREMKPVLHSKHKTNFL
jgi:hypothetical protein